MSEILSFPGLGLEFSINRVAFTFFSRPIYWYGVMFALAFLLGAIYILRRYKLFGVDEDRMIDVLLGGVVGGVIGARLYYVAFTWDTYRGDLARIFRVWEGGIAMYGSIIGAVLAILLMCRLRKVKFLPLLDLFAGGLILAQAIGRWGNFFNMEAFGANTDLPWGMTSDTISNYLLYRQDALAAVGVAVDPFSPVHPTFFYESLWCLLGFLLLFWFTKKRRYDGEMTLVYFGWYGLGRFFIEGLRTDSLMLGQVRVSQMLAALCVVASAVAMILIRRKIKAADDPEYLKLFVDTEDGQAILAGTFYPKKGEARSDSKPADKDEDDKDEDKDKADENNNAVADDGAPDDADAGTGAENDGVDDAEDESEADTAEAQAEPEEDVEEGRDETEDQSGPNGADSEPDGDAVPDETAEPAPDESGEGGDADDAHGKKDK